MGEIELGEVHGWRMRLSMSGKGDQAAEVVTLGLERDREQAEHQVGMDIVHAISPTGTKNFNASCNVRTIS
jgi:hypothetical protein